MLKGNVETLERINGELAETALSKLAAGLLRPAGDKKLPPTSRATSPHQ